MTNPFFDLDLVKLENLKRAFIQTDNFNQFFTKYQADYDADAIPDLIGEVNEAIAFRKKLQGKKNELI